MTFAPPVQCATGLRHAPMSPQCDKDNIEPPRVARDMVLYDLGKSGRFGFAGCYNRAVVIELPQLDPNPKWANRGINIRGDGESRTDNFEHANAPRQR